LANEFSSYRRGTIMGQRMGGFQITPDTFEAIENYILWCRLVPKKFPGAMDMLVRMMSYYHLGTAQKYAAGPVDPKQGMTGAAWKIPVRRITGRYFFGWKVRKVSLGTWQVYNDSREAFFIEYGIHRNPATGGVSSKRIRRPINKLSMQRTLRFVATTSAAHRVWSSIYFPPPGMRKGKGFLWTMQSPGVMGQAFPKFFGEGGALDVSRDTPIS
jgi:hypothetical protein